MLRRKNVSVRAAVAAAACFVSVNASAEQFWNTGNGDISTTANYTDNLDTNPTWFNVGNDATVTLTTGGTFGPGRLRIGHAGALFPGSAIFNMDGGSLTPGGLNNSNPVGADVGLCIGLNGVGTMNQSGGTVTVTRAIMVGSDNTTNNTGATPGSGTLNLSGSAFMRSTNNDMIIGAGNPGAVTVGDSAQLFVLPTAAGSTQSNDLNVGQTVASTFTMNANAVVTVCNSVQVGSGSTFTMNGGTLSTRARNTLGLFFTSNAANGNLTIGNTGTNSTFVMNSGTVNVGNQMTVGQSGSTGATFTIASGTLTTKTVNVTGANGNISVGTGSAVGATFNITGGSVVGHNRFLLGTSSSTATGTAVNQSAGSLAIDLNLVVSDTGGDSTYNFTGGTITANAELSRVGRQGTGTMNQSGTGIANFNAGLGIGDDAGVITLTATGTYQISGGEMHTTLAAASGAALRIGTGGTGTFRVVGDDGIVDVNGDMLVDKTTKGVGTLAYRFEAGDLLSVIDVSGTATFNSLAALSLDTSLSAPTQRVYDVLTAANIVDNGLAITNGWAYQIINGGANGKLLQVAQVGTLYWDTDGAAPGAGGASPSGIWDASTTNFTADATGSTATSAVSTIFADDVVFAAGADGGGSYTVNVTGTQSARSVQVPRGNVTFAGGAINTPTFDVSAGAGGTMNSTLSQNLTKIGAGTLTLGAANTMTSTTVSAGTLVAAHADAFGGGAVNVSDGALAQVQADLPKAVTVTTLATNTTGKFDLTNNSMVIRNMTAPQVQALLQTGYNGGHWDGATGITSATAAASTETSIGYASNASLNLTEFKGVTGLTTNDVLVKYTYAGDANLDGKVDIGDLGLLAGAWQQSGKVWFDGDFTYNGTVDIGDLGLLAGNWQKGVSSGQLLVSFDQAMAQFAAFDGIAVPEPASLGLLALGGIGLLGRRRRGTR
jgi:hypothetical protein